MQPVQPVEQVGKFEITEREKYLLKIVAAMLAKEPCLAVLYDVRSKEDAMATIFRILCKTIEDLTEVAQS